MKYIQLFESFESKKLATVLKYIKDDNSKKNFLEILTYLSKKIVFPISEFQDSDFQYLYWSKAIQCLGTLC